MLTFTCVCVLEDESGSSLERVVANERNPSRKNAHLPENLLAGLWPDGGKRRMLFIETPLPLSHSLNP